MQVLDARRIALLQTGSAPADGKPSMVPCCGRLAKENPAATTRVRVAAGCTWFEQLPYWPMHSLDTSMTYGWNTSPVSSGGNEFLLPPQITKRLPAQTAAAFLRPRF